MHLIDGTKSERTLASDMHPNVSRDDCERRLLSSRNQRLKYLPSVRGHCWNPSGVIDPVQSHLNARSRQRLREPNRNGVCRMDPMRCCMLCRMVRFMLFYCVLWCNPQPHRSLNTARFRVDRAEFAPLRARTPDTHNIPCRGDQAARDTRPCGIPYQAAQDAHTS